MRRKYNWGTEIVNDCHEAHKGDPKSQSISKKARIVSARSRGRTKGDCKGPLHYHRLLNEESEVSTIPGMLRDTMNQRQYVLIYLNVKME
jgi:hypothetical protein